MVALSAVPAWPFRHWPWIALALAAPIVGWAVRRRPPGPLGALAVAGPVAALGWSAHLLLDGMGASGGPSSPGGPPLATAAVLGAVALLVPAAGVPVGRAGRVLVAIVVGSAVAALGFGLGRGVGPGAVAAATAVLVAGSPVALLLVPRRIRRLAAVVVPEELLTTGELEIRAVHVHGDAEEAAVRRFAAALHAAWPPADARVAAPTSAEPRSALGGAMVAAVTGPLPGVSDLDGHPDTGLRGVVSELHEDRVVAHAVLVGPPAWLAEHGVAAPDGIDPGAPAVAWDGVARGWLEIAASARPGASAGIAALLRRGVEVVSADSDRARSGSTATEVASLPFPDLAAVARAVRRQHRQVLLRRVCLVVAITTAVGGAAAALVGLLNPVTALAVPVTSALMVAAGTRRRHHPFGATA